MRTWLGLACVSFLVFSTAEARAESAIAHFDAWPDCDYGTPEITPPAGPLPSNWPLFEIALHGGLVTPTATTLTRMSDGHVVPLRFDAPGPTIRFTPLEALDVGGTYVVTHPPCAGAQRQTTYTITSPIAAPASAGTLSVLGVFATNLGGRGLCHRETYVLFELNADPAFADAPWSEFQWDVVIDGGTVGTARIGDTRMQVTVNCGQLAGSLYPGDRSAHAEAGPLVMSGGRTLTSESVPFTIDCASAVRVTSDTMRGLTPDEIAYWDTDDGSCSPEAGVPDAGTGMDASMDGSTSGDAAMHTEPDTRANCGCSVPGRGRGGLGALLVLVAIGLVSNRRSIRHPIRRARPL